jgi:hypothetical protein
VTVVSKEDAPTKLKLELVKKLAGENLPVVVKVKQINKRDEIILFPRMKPMPRAYFVNAIIKRDKVVKKFFLFLIPRGTKTVSEYVVRCNVYFSECLESLEDVVPKFSQELSNLLLSDDMKQHIEGVTGMQKFHLDETMVKLMLIVFGMSIPFGLLMNVVLHLVPSQVVLWGP